MKVKKPEISVIMPVYNSEKYLGEAIESILNQDFTNFEFIILDDCSTDSSYKICQYYAFKDIRIKLYENEKNRGISYTRSKLIQLSHTNYIASQDSDDISMPDRLRLCYNFLEKNVNCGVVSGNNIIINNEGENIGERIYTDNIGSTILKKSPISQPSSMFRREIYDNIGGYDLELDYGEDYDLWLRMYAGGYEIRNLNFNILKYRLHTLQSKTQKLKPTLKNTIFIQKRAIQKYKIKAHISDYTYLFLESGLLLLPNNFILFLFKTLEYKNAK